MGALCENLSWNNPTSRGHTWARGVKNRNHQIFLDLPSIWPKWSGSKRILITSAPKTKSPHHILRANFGFLKKTIRKTYETIFWEIQEYLSNLNEKCELFQIIFFEITFVTKIEEKQFGAKKFFWTPLPEKTGPKRENNGKNDQF